MKKFSAAIFIFCIHTPLLVLLRGWTTKVLWDWFAVPVGLPRLSLPTLLGFGLIFTVLTAQRPQTSPSDGDKKLWEVVISDIGYWIFLCGIFLLEGKILQLFVK